MKRLVALVLACAYCFGISPAIADDETDVNPYQDGVGIGASEDNWGTESDSAPTGQSITSIIDIGTDLVEQFCVGVNWNEGCEPVDPEDVAISAEMVATAFKYVPLPESNLVIQPPDGRTLVNFETNVYTDAPEVLAQPSAVRILGRVVQLRIEPMRFAWDFGDGTVLRTTERGAAYPDLEITHKYQRKGRVQVRLDTTYRAYWRLSDTAPWRLVDGTVTITGTPQRLQVLEAQPVLVG